MPKDTGSWKHKKASISVTGMTCSTCATRIEQALRAPSIVFELATSLAH